MTSVAVRSEEALYSKVVESLGATHRLNLVPKCVVVSGVSDDVAKRLKDALAKHGYMLQDSLMDGEVPDALKVLFLNEARPDELNRMIAKDIRAILLLDDGVDEYLNGVRNAIHIVYGQGEVKSEYSDYELWVFEQLRLGREPGSFSEAEFLAGLNERLGKGEVA